MLCAVFLYYEHEGVKTYTEVHVASASVTAMKYNVVHTYILHFNLAL